MSTTINTVLVHSPWYMGYVEDREVCLPPRSGELKLSLERSMNSTSSDEDFSRSITAFSAAEDLAAY